MRPRILVTTDDGRGERRSVGYARIELRAAYVRAVEQAGGAPFLVAPVEAPDTIATYLAIMDGLVITGGAFDVDPEMYGETTQARHDGLKPARTAFERALLEGALAQDVPVLGICGGMQLLNVVLGGTLHQHIADAFADPLEHEQPTDSSTAWHPITLSGWPRDALGAPGATVNSTHHQAVAKLGRSLVALGQATDGVVELISKDGGRRVVGAEWHPEQLDDALSRILYENLVEQARRDRFA